MTSSETNVSLDNSLYEQICWYVAPVSQAMYITAFFLVIAYSMPFNIWVIYLVSMELLAKREILILSQAITDVIFSFSLILSLIMIFSYNETLSQIRWHIMCAALYGRVFFNCFICVERYVAVVHPVMYRSSNLHQFRLWCTVLTWPVLLGFSTVHVVFKVPFQIFLALLFSTLIIIIFCSLAVLKALRKPKPGKADSANMDQVKRNAFRVITITLVISVASGFMYGFMNLIWISRYHYCVSNAICVWLYFPSFVPQPLLYLFRAGKLNWVRCLLTL